MNKSMVLSLLDVGFILCASSSVFFFTLAANVDPLPVAVGVPIVAALSYLAGRSTGRWVEKFRIIGIIRSKGGLHD